jgi:hypothetical protein
MRYRSSLKKARELLKELNPSDFNGIKIWHKRGSKRWYVGTYIEWLNK